MGSLPLTRIKAANLERGVAKASVGRSTLLAAEVWGARGGGVLTVACWVKENRGLGGLGVGGVGCTPVFLGGLTLCFPALLPDAGYRAPAQDSQLLLLSGFTGLLTALSILVTALLLWKKVGDPHTWQHCLSGPFAVAPGASRGAEGPPAHPPRTASPGPGEGCGRSLPRGLPAHGPLLAHLHSWARGTLLPMPGPLGSRTKPGSTRLF